MAACIHECSKNSLEQHDIILSILQIAGSLLSAVSFCDLMWYATRNSVQDISYHPEPVDFVDAAVRTATFVSLSRTEFARFRLLHYLYYLIVA